MKGKKGRRLEEQVVWQNGFHQPQSPYPNPIFLLQSKFEIDRRKAAFTRREQMVWKNGRKDLGTAIIF